MIRKVLARVLVKARMSTQLLLFAVFVVDMEEEFEKGIGDLVIGGARFLSLAYADNMYY